jgi:hypothetical protein
LLLCKLSSLVLSLNPVLYTEAIVILMDSSLV